MARKFSIYDTFEYKGYWWIPNNPNQKVAGILTFSEDGINLELFNTLNPDRTNFGMETDKFQIVLGICEGSKEITLYDGFETRFKMSGIISTKLTFNKMLIGKHFNSKEEMNFSSISINYSYIEEWMRFNPFHDQHVFDDGPRIKSVGTVYTFPPVFEEDIESINAKIKAGYHFNTSGELYKTKIFQHTGSLQVFPYENKNLEWFIEVMEELQNLLTLLMNRAVYPKYIELKGETIDLERGIKESITLYVLPMDEFRESKVRVSELFINFRKIEGIIGKVLNNWFSFEDKSSKIIYLRSLYDSGMDWESKFLNYAKSIESFHRNTSGNTGKFVSDEEYEPLKNAMLDSLPSDIDVSFKQKLESTLKYAHHHGFERRIREIFKSIDGELFKMIFDSNRHMRKFAENMTRTRDYYTHYGDKPVILFKDWGLFFANIRLHVILFFHFCKQLGISDEIIRTSIEEDYQLTHSLSMAKKELFD